MAHEYFNDSNWSFAVLYQDYKHVYQMTKEDEYVFCMTHLIRHFQFTGICVRDVLDVYLYCEKYKEVLDFGRVEELLERFGIKEFEENVRRIAYKWFGEEENAEFDEVEKFILKGKSRDNLMYHEIGRKRGKSKYVVRLLFPEFRKMKQRYPILRRVPVLLPAAWMVRILSDVFSKETSIKERVHTVQLIQEANVEKVEDVQQIFKKLGIPEEKK